jgi:hypothetical protein
MSDNKGNFKLFAVTYLVEVTVHAGHKVLIEVDLYFTDVGDPGGILDQQLRPHPIHLQSLINIILISYIFIH